MHAKPDLRVFFEWMINRSSSVITDVIPLGDSMQLHWLAEKMIEEFNPNQGHILFPLPFIRTIHSSHGWQASLCWVSSLLKPHVEISDFTRHSISSANNAIDSLRTDSLTALDERAAALWNANPSSGTMLERSIANFTWAVMAFICIHHDVDFECQSSTVRFQRDKYTREQFAERSASSAINLALDTKLRYCKDLQTHVATSFSLEMARLSAE